MKDRQKPTGITRLLRAFGYSFHGFHHAWREEAAFRQEVGLAVLVVPAGLYFGHSGVERALLVSPMLLILVVEILNSAVEAVVDRHRTASAGRHGQGHGVGRRHDEFRIARNRMALGLVRPRALNTIYPPIHY